MALTNAQKTILSILAAVCLISFSIAAWAVAKWGFTRSIKPDTTRGVTVADSAQVKVTPDTAFVEFGIVTKDKNAKSAARANAARTSAVTGSIRKAGVPESDIKTIDYTLEPTMNWDKNPPVTTGYSASNCVRVRTKDIGKLGALLDAAIAAGANDVRGLTFDVEDKRKLRKEALALAVKKAEGKAQAIAEALGAKLGPAISASESVDMYVPASRNCVKAKTALSPEPTPIAPGEATVSAQVKVVYSLR